MQHQDARRRRDDSGVRALAAALRRLTEGDIELALRARSDLDGDRLPRLLGMVSPGRPIDAPTVLAGLNCLAPRRLRDAARFLGEPFVHVVHALLFESLRSDSKPPSGVDDDVSALSQPHPVNLLGLAFALAFDDGEIDRTTFFSAMASLHLDGSPTEEESLLETEASGGSRSTGPAYPWSTPEAVLAEVPWSSVLATLGCEASVLEEQLLAEVLAVPETTAAAFAELVRLAPLRPSAWFCLGVASRLCDPRADVPGAPGPTTVALTAGELYGLSLAHDPGPLSDFVGEHLSATSVLTSLPIGYFLNAPILRALVHAGNLRVAAKVLARSRAPFLGFEAAVTSCVDAAAAALRERRLFDASVLLAAAAGAVGRWRRALANEEATNRNLDLLIADIGILRARCLRVRRRFAECLDALGDVDDSQGLEVAIEVRREEALAAAEIDDASTFHLPLGRDQEVATLSRLAPAAASISALNDISPGDPIGAVLAAALEIARDRPAAAFHRLGELIQERAWDQGHPWCVSDTRIHLSLLSVRLGPGGWEEAALLDAINAHDCPGSSDLARRLVSVLNELSSEQVDSDAFARIFEAVVERHGSFGLEGILARRLDPDPTPPPRKPVEGESTDGAGVPPGLATSDEPRRHGSAGHLAAPLLTAAGVGRDERT